MPAIRLWLGRAKAGFRFCPIEYMWNDVLTMNRLAAAMLVLAFALLAYGAARWLTAQPYFAIRTVVVQAAGATPLEHVTAERVARVCVPQINGTFFTADLAQTKAAFESLPWVRSASVRRQWPDRLMVRLEEHRALARWNDEGGNRFVSIHGEAFNAAGEAALGARLPLLTGPEGSQREVALQYALLRERLSVIGLAPQVLTLSSRQAWTLRLVDGLVVEIGREQAAASVQTRIERFVAHYAATVGRLNTRVEVVDLRYPNGFAVRAPGLRAQAQATKPAKPRVVAPARKQKLPARALKPQQPRA